MPEPAILAKEIRKSFRTTIALDGFDLAVAPGTIHGLLGPNGAGKSTAVRVLTTLTRADRGEATVDGHDVRHSPSAVRTAIGLIGQNPAVDEILTGEQNLVLFARLLGLPKTSAKRRSAELLEQFGLLDAARKAVGTYSGGMRRRLDIAACLVLRPSVLFLDEPTTGLDPRGRNEVWAAVRELRAAGTTVLLTTQYLEEADQLADRISVMTVGRVVAEGTPDALKRELGADVISAVVHDPADVPAAAAILARVTGAPAAEEPDRRSASVTAADGSAAVIAAVREFDAAGIRIDDIGLRRPTLDEVFLSITDEPGTGESADDTTQLEQA